MNTLTGEIYTPEQIETMNKIFKHAESSKAELSKLAKVLENIKPMNVDPTEKQMKRKPPKIGRNEVCPCGSNKKFKHCCLEVPK